MLADPEGNEFCVIEETNNWLAGTGFLGELAADGTREVGVFWAAALDWPLVHDEDGETAIQPPEGGMKIAWGGPPLNERAGRNRMHLVLVADDLDAEVERLVSLGASVVARGDDVEMADPDGNEFHLRRAEHARAAARSASVGRPSSGSRAADATGERRLSAGARRPRGCGGGP